MTSTSKCYRPAPDVVHRRVGDESILVPVRHNVGHLDSVFTLSTVAVRIWELLDGTRDARTIGEALTEEFEIDTETATADVAGVLDSLLDEGLIVEAD